LCNHYQARLTILHVDQKNSPDDANRNVRRVVEALSLWSVADAIIENGEPADEILQTASQLNPELIVLGARHQEPARINSHLPRPTIAKVVAGARCPVLTVRQLD
jgi:nucleotide-binding universal stress UspA family protein